MTHIPQSYRSGTFGWLRARLLALSALAWTGIAVASAAPLADPSRLAGSFAGGNGYTEGRDVAVAPNGDVILVGLTDATDLPVTDASTLTGGADAFVARFDAKFRTLRWLIYLGGSNDDKAMAVATDASGNVYVAGTTDSTDFPTTSAYDASANGSNDVFVTKLAAANGAHQWSTYLGGNSQDEAADIVVDGNGRAIVVGSTWSSTFPSVSPIGANWQGSDAFITRFAANGASLGFSTYYGIAQNEYGVAVDVDAANDLYVGVYTHGYESGLQSNEVLKIDESALTLTYAFQIDSAGGSGSDGVQLNDLAVTSEGEVAFTGSLWDDQSTLPMINPWQATPGGTLDFFVGKLNTAGNAILWTTWLGGNDDEGEPSIALTSDEKVWVAGYSISTSYPVRDSLAPFGGAVSLLAADGQNLLFSTRIGGWSGLYIHGLALASDGVPVIAGMGDPLELALTGLLPAGNANAFAARVQALPSARFLPRRSVALPPLERTIEPYYWLNLDLDSDGVNEMYTELPDRTLDLAWGHVVTDRFGDGRDVVAISIGTLGGARVAGTIDQDGDGEIELVVEDPRLDAGTVQGWLLDHADQDVDLVVVGRGGAGGALFVDLDNDGEQEVIVSAPHLADGAVARMDLDPVDGDTDVLLIGGLPRAVLDLDQDGEPEVIAERGGTGGTFSAGSVEAGGDGDDDVLFVVGTYAFARDLDGDGTPELFVENGSATPGTASFSAPVVFVGGRPETTADVDGDGEPEVVVSDGTAADGTMDPIDALDGSDGDHDVVFVGGAFRGAVDVDGDGEPELVVEDSAGTADTFGELDGAEPIADGDTDLVAVRGLAVMAADVDDDGELEILAESTAQSAGAFLDLDGVESPSDSDADVVFVGGLVATVADLDGDWELEAVAEDAGAAAGTFDPLDGVESPSDSDADVVFVAGTWRATHDLDQDDERELLFEDAGLGSAASEVDGMEASPDSDADVIFVADPVLTLRDLDGDGEAEIVVEDGGVSAPSVVFTDLETDGDVDLVAIPTTAGWWAADLDGDGEHELVLEHAGATAAAVVRVDGAEGTGDGDGDVLFVGGAPQLVADVDGDSEPELVASAGITAGTASVYRTLEGLGNGDPDVVFIGGTARGVGDVDGDWESEVVVENGTGGATSRIDDVDALGNGDADVVFTGGRVRHFANVDGDDDYEAIVEDSAALPGNSSRFDALDGAGDADVIYVAGTFQGETDLDGDWESEIAATDPNLAGGTVVDPQGWDGSSDVDGALIGTDTVPASPSLAVTAPNGGETVTLGNPLTITWSASGFAGTVKVELSRDGGSTWETLFANTANDGSEAWTSAGSATGTALIRVTSRNLVSPASDTSNATFTLL